MDYVVGALRENRELAVFLTLAVGFLIGRLKIGSFKLGTVVGTLLAGVLIGQLNIKVPSTVKSVFFLLFLFTTGYKVGPQFKSMSNMIDSVIFRQISVQTDLISARYV